MAQERRKMVTRARRQEKLMAKQREREEKMREKAEKKKEKEKGAKQHAPLFTPGFLAARSPLGGGRADA